MSWNAPSSTPTFTLSEPKKIRPSWIASLRRLEQTTILLDVAGPKSQEIYQTFAFDPPGEDEADPRDDVEIVLSKFREYCNPRCNTVYERCRFWSRNQAEGETVDSG